MTRGPELDDDRFKTPTWSAPAGQMYSPDKQNIKDHKSQGHILIGERWCWPPDKDDTEKRSLHERDGKWWFWGEDWATEYGPFADKLEARKQFKLFCVRLESNRKEPKVPTKRERKEMKKVIARNAQQLEEEKTHAVLANFLLECEREKSGAGHITESFTREREDWERIHKGITELLEWAGVEYQDAGTGPEIKTNIGLILAGRHKETARPDRLEAEAFHLRKVRHNKDCCPICLKERSER